MVKKRIRTILLAACFLVFCSSGLLLSFMLLSDGGDVETFRVESESDREGMRNPIDFEKLQEINPDIYAWIYVPGTRIDYPVASVQGDEDEDYYLNHNFRRAYEFAGTIYSHKENARDFSDPVTILYGHNMLNGSMFAGLNKFADRKFFEDHDTVFVFTPECYLTYSIVSYYRSDNKNILQAYDFFREQDSLESYLEVIRNARNGNTRKGISVSVSDHILTLSTCSSVGWERRLLQCRLTESRPWEGQK